MNEQTFNYLNCIVWIVKQQQGFIYFVQHIITGKAIGSCPWEPYPTYEDICYQAIIAADELEKEAYT